MFGLLRLVLSLAVATSHTGWRPFGILDGQVAVILFFVVSGHAMSGLESRLRFAGRPVASLLFLRDRLLRLWPQYLVWMVLAAIAAGFGIWPPYTPADARLSPELLGLNASVLPITFKPLLPVEHLHELVPQAWSIGTELSFYVALPLVAASRRIAFALALASLVVFLAACLRLVAIYAFAYFLPFGTLAFFILGHAVCRRDRALAALILAGLAVCFLTLARSARLDPFMQAILIGSVACVPALLLAERRFAIPAALDRRFGDAAYGIYLSHLLIIAVLGLHSWPVRSVLPVALLSALAGWLGAAAIDRPIAHFRRRHREAGRRSRIDPGLTPPDPVRPGGRSAP